MIDSRGTVIRGYPFSSSRLVVRAEHELQSCKKSPVFRRTEVTETNFGEEYFFCDLDCAWVNSIEKFTA